MIWVWNSKKAVMFKPNETQSVAALQEKLQRWKMMHAILRPALRKRWIRMFVRWALALILYPIFWEYRWVRITLYVSLPLMLFYFLLMIGLTWGLPKRISDLERQLGQNMSPPPSGFEPDALEPGPPGPEH